MAHGRFGARDGGHLYHDVQVSGAGHADAVKLLGKVRFAIIHLDAKANLIKTGIYQLVKQIRSEQVSGGVKSQVTVGPA